MGHTRQSQNGPHGSRSNGVISAIRLCQNWPIKDSRKGETMNDNTDRTYRTPGDYAISESPFKTPDTLAEAMRELTGKIWTVSFGYLGGRGDCTFIENSGNGLTLIPLWLDTSGGWHPERKVGRDWLPNGNLLKRLIEASRPQEFDADEIDAATLAMYDEDLAACKRQNDKRSLD
jgi:hypothetical protein